MADEYLMMEGRLVQLERELRSLEIKIEGLCSSLRSLLNTALIPVDEIDLPQIISQSQELSLAYAEITGKKSRISRLKKELGRG